VPTCDGFVLRPQDIPERFVPHSDTWFYSRVAGTFSERGGWHGCQMPEQLLGRIIKACSNEGDLVIDPFAGSGTTPAVAKKLNRHYLACELSEEYARNVKKRLARIRTGDLLDGPENAALSAPRTKAGRRLKEVAGSNGKTTPKAEAGSAERTGNKATSRSREYDDHRRDERSSVHVEVMKASLQHRVSLS
ncbi:MAG: site-specific DNA-methyltransferase, partial [Gemmatimonadetes bacterium]|nr:site-specific DNA-methyltransferase [Gemmatimonadota bacterium]